MNTRIFVIFLIGILTKLSFSQGTDVIVHPTPFFLENLTWITFTDSQTGYVTTNNRIVKTTNAGENWNNIFSSSQYNYRRIYFINKDTGFVTTSENYILRTTNGGDNWSEIWMGNWYYYSYWGISFLNNNTGFIAGGGQTGGGQSRMIAKITTNTGIDWSDLNTQANGYSFSDIYYTDSLHGFIIGSNKILRTTNGGSNWIADSIAEFSPNRIIFINSNIGYISYNSTGILFTENGGNNWIYRNVQGSNCCRLMVYSDSNDVVYVADRKYNVFKSTNYGVNWSLSSNAVNSVFNSFHFQNNDGYAVGENGYMMKTTDYGVNWFKNVEQHKLNSIKIKNGNKILSAGEKGLIFLSDDFGNNWKKVQTGYNFEINSINTDNSRQYFIAAGDSGKLLRSDTSGLIWEHINLNTNEKLTKVITTNSYVFIAGTNNSFFYSTDNGSSWTDCAPKKYPQIIFRGIHESNNVFYLAGDIGTILQSTDRGINWNHLVFPQNFPLNEIHFVNAQTGFVAGKPIYSNHLVNFYKTTNSGNSWDSVSFRAPSSDLDFKKIVFLNESTGYMFATFFNNLYTNNYLLYKTTDNGRIWSIKTNFGEINDMDFSNYDTAFTVGNFGEIYRTTNAGSWIFVISEIKLLSLEIPDDYELFNYPNPFNPATKIKFSIPREGIISIKIYDLSGKEIAVLANEKFREGSYEINFSADDKSLSSGIYFVQLRTGNYLKSSKMILLR